ncbi:MAG TPA: hypothetical protein VFS40_04910 [Gemmatimonadales bacterium]|nr:hypothetical protein [Gemmatimonadales bacterium]
MHEHAPATSSRVQVRPSPVRTILVVDNDEGVRGAMCRILRTAGYRVIPAGQGMLAHRCLEDASTRVDLIVTELLPPAPDGFHLGIPYGWRRATTPVLFTSRAPREWNIREGLLDPRAAFLRRPFPPRDLVRAVRDTLAAWRELPAA